MPKFLLKFTPLEFETLNIFFLSSKIKKLKFTPLEFETILLHFGCPFSFS